MISDDYQVEEVVIQQVLNEIIQGQPKKVESSNILIIRLVYPKRLICLVRSSCQLSFTLLLVAILEVCMNLRILKHHYIFKFIMVH